MIIRTSSSYQLHLPDDIVRDVDGSPVSFWRSGEPLLLQLSSHQRTHGNQVTSRRRIEEQTGKGNTEWTFRPSNHCADSSVDQECAETVEGETAWLHCYFVWPHVAVYATISGLIAQVRDTESWAHSALRTLALVLQ